MKYNTSIQTTKQENTEKRSTCAVALRGWDGKWRWTCSRGPRRAESLSTAVCRCCRAIYADKRFFRKCPVVLLGTRRYNFQRPRERYTAPRYRQTDGRTDGRQYPMMTIAYHVYCV